MLLRKYEELIEFNCFLPFNIMFIHTAFTAPSFSNLCKMISPPTLLCFFAEPGYCMRVSHMTITHLEWFPNTIKFNFPRSDIVWCGKPKVNVVK